MTIVITSWRRGSTSYLSGQRICDSTGRMDSWGCSTIDSNPFVACSWFGSSGPAYITQSCYGGLTDGEKAACVSRYAGIVTNSGYYYVYDTAYYNHYKLKIESIVDCWSAACFNLRPDIRCKDVVCDPICIGADKYSQECATEGEDAGTCVFDQLIEANSPSCPGYDPCKDVVCEPVCDGYDLYETECVDGVCIKGALIEANNRDICGYDPCRDVVCPDKCYGMDKYSEVCEEGVCLPDRLLEPNSEDCGYVPYVCTDGQKRYPETCWDGSVIHAEVCQNNAWVPSGETCPTKVCTEGYKRYPTTCWDGSVIHAEVCQNNAWVSTGETCPFEPVPDPCEGVICDPTCVGDDLFDTVCDNGVCIRGALIEANNEDICGYVPPGPDPEPEPETETDWITYILIVVAGILFYIIAKRG